MEQSPYPTHLNQPSPHSVADNSCDADLTHLDHVPVSELHEDASLLPERLTRLAHLISQSTNMSRDDSVTIHQYLDTCESLLDPRPALTEEIAKCRPPPSTQSPTKTIISPPTTDSPTMTDPLPSAPAISHPQLTSLLAEVTALNNELKNRRKESSHIYELFTSECQELAQNISDLEGEVTELKADITEDSAEREALEGTVCGLESWVDGWQKQYDWAMALKKSSPGARQRRWTKRKNEEPNESDVETLLDGIAAWMRGWKDLEEGFHNRESVRRLRREERQKVRIKASKGQSPEAQGHTFD